MSSAGRSRRSREEKNYSDIADPNKRRAAGTAPAAYEAARQMVASGEAVTLVEACRNVGVSIFNVSKHKVCPQRL